MISEGKFDFSSCGAGFWTGFKNLGWFLLNTGSALMGKVFSPIQTTWESLEAFNSFTLYVASEYDCISKEGSTKTVAEHFIKTNVHWWEMEK